MRICGINKTTLLDYPGHVAATVFTGGCNFRCPFCHNKDLVVNSTMQPEISMDEIRAFLKKRKGLLDGICITGGEPTLQEGLEEFIAEQKELGYLVKLDSNGYEPKILSDLLEKKLLDYIAMDVKASKENYARAAGVRNFDLDKVEQSVQLIRESTIPYEFRTTVVKGIHSVEEFERIGQWLAGSKAYFLQTYREDENVLEKGYASFPREKMEEMARLAGKYIERVELRG